MRKGPRPEIRAKVSLQADGKELSNYFQAVECKMAGKIVITLSRSLSKEPWPNERSSLITVQMEYEDAAKLACEIFLEITEAAKRK